MQYKEISPPLELKPYIKCFWTLENSAVNPPVPERILPDGCTELIFHFGDLFIQLYGERREIQPRSFMYGQLKQFIEVMPSGKTGIVAARFFPYGFSAFTALAASAMTEKKMSIDLLFGESGKKIEHDIVHSKSMEERLQLLQSFLSKQVKEEAEEDRILSYCVEALADSNGQLPIQNLTTNLQMSYKTLERRFYAKIGVSPKQYARIVRFHHLFHQIESKQIQSLTDLAYESGYYDQAHFIRDFKHFSGISPRQYFNQKNELSDFLTKQAPDV
jgi:AraC-like DNA-binding protein